LRRKASAFIQAWLDKDGGRQRKELALESSAVESAEKQEQDAQWMRRAIALATANVKLGLGPFGAVIVRDGILVAEGQNCVTVENDPTAHAEVTAIRRACAALESFSLDGCIIYSSCEPCPMCLGAILWSRCAALYFGNTSGDAEAAGFADADYYAQICGPVQRGNLPSKNLLREEAAASFDAWVKLPGRIVY
jgi:guanine deaminase